MSQKRLWIAYSLDRYEWKSVWASNGEEAAEEAERASDELDDSSDEWDSDWIVAEAPEGWDEKLKQFPDSDSFEGEEVRVSVHKEIKYHYRITR